MKASKLYKKITDFVTDNKMSPDDARKLIEAAEILNKVKGEPKWTQNEDLTRSWVHTRAPAWGEPPNVRVMSSDIKEDVKISNLEPMQPRAWHKEKQEYFDVAHINYNDNTVYLISRNLRNYMPPFFVKFGKVILEWPTGINDKTGKMIYHGDILESCYGIEPITIDDTHGYRFMFGMDQLCKGYALDGKIIGNVNENPELLEVKE